MAPRRSLAGRLLLLVVAAAALKVGFEQWQFRNAVTDTLVLAYRKEALGACQRAARAQNLVIETASWSKPQAVELSVGAPEVGAGLWSGLQHALAGGTPTAFLVVTARRQPYAITCAYDLVRLEARIRRSS